MDDTEVECPECGHVFYPDLEPVTFDVEEATQALLRNYLNGGSAGDAEKLKTAIENCLVNKLGVSQGVI